MGVLLDTKKIHCSIKVLKSFKFLQLHCITLSCQTASSQGTWTWVRVQQQCCSGWLHSNNSDCKKKESTLHTAMARIPGLLLNSLQGFHLLGHAVALSAASRVREKGGLCEYLCVCVCVEKERKRERSRQKHAHLGVCLRQLVPQGSTTQIILKQSAEQIS